MKIWDRATETPGISRSWSPHRDSLALFAVLGICFCSAAQEPQKAERAPVTSENLDSGSAQRPTRAQGAAAVPEDRSEPAPAVDGSSSASPPRESSTARPEGIAKKKAKTSKVDAPVDPCDAELVKAACELDKCELRKTYEIRILQLENEIHALLKRQVDGRP